MGHQNHAHRQRIAQIEDQLQDLVLNRHIKRRRGFIGQQQARVAGKRDGDHHALSHAPGELVRVFIQPPRRVRDADQIHQLARPRLAPGAVQIRVGAQVLVNLQADRQHRVQRRHRFLKDHRDLAATHRAQIARRQGQQIAPLPDHLAACPGVQRQQTEDRAQRHAFARPGLAHQPHHLARHDAERHIVHRGDRPGSGGERRRQVAHVEGGDHLRVLSTSASPSPRRLKPSPVTTMAMPGNTDIHHAVVMKFLPSAICTPHSGVGGWAPRPR